MAKDKRDKLQSRPPEQRANRVTPTPQPVLAVAESHVRIGPLPAADELATYGTVKEDFPERIVRMAEREQEHRFAMDRSRAWWIHIGQVLAGAIAFGSFGVAVYAIANDQPWVAGACITELAAIIGVFLWRDRPRGAGKNDD